MYFVGKKVKINSWPRAEKWPCAIPVFFQIRSSFTDITETGTVSTVSCQCQKLWGKAIDGMLLFDYR